MAADNPNFYVNKGAILSVDSEGSLLTNLNGVDVPAELSDDYGPANGALVITDEDGNPTRAIFLAEIR